ncbi:hypothetical protein [Nocardia amamiensis]|uniref:hypothetical protein n=1 Tax=Nocardia amamiensis TaxID=404578 RepID=UPI0012F4B058|nr:hypothetical protein [Nocardia amamiensis]
MDSHLPNPAGMPQAGEWITHFAVWLPAQPTPTTVREAFAAARRRAKAWVRGRISRSGSAHAGHRSPDWVHMLSASIVDAHHRRALSESGPDAVNDEIAWCAWSIDAKLAALVDLPAARVGLGELVSAMAARWVSYAQQPLDYTAVTGVPAAQRAYNARVEQLSALPRGGTP